MAQKQYTRQWALADSLENLGQAQSALDVVTQIFSESNAEGNHPQAIKAMMYRIRIESGFSEDYFENAVALLNSELEAAATPVRQVLSSILAQVYWEYYRNNQWEINQRTPLAGDNPGEISTWDARKFVSVTTGLYRQSLLEPALLQQTGIGAFEAILEKNKENRKLRPSLYDFLAFRAIDFFSSERASVTRPATQFAAGDARYFAPAAGFTKLELASADPLSFEFQAMQLFQQLLRFRLADAAAPEPLVDADLLRLAYAHRISTLPEKESLYIQALRQLYTLHEGHPVSAEVAYALARQLRNQGFTYQPLVSDKHKWLVKEALELAEKTAAKFPETDGGKNCSVLAKEIRASMLRITANGQVIPQRPSLVSVEYRNVDTLFIRILKADPEKSRVSYHREGRDLLKELVRQKPLKSWHQVIPDDGDFQPHRTEIMIPPMDPGYYILLVSSTENFSTSSEISSFPFWSTALSVINRRLTNGDAEIMVLDRNSGSPLKGVRVRHYSGLYDYKKREVVFRAGEEARTDQNGYVVIKPSVDERQDQAYLLLTTRKDRFMTDAFFDYYAPYREPAPETRTFFFTDRSIYRPGQPIHFKGIVLEKRGSKSEIRKDYTLMVRFNDVNGQEIASREFRTNEFGSFSGTFTAPMGALTGMMPIFTETGRTFVRVEEYKRPKFEVTFDPVEGAYKLDSEVEVKGRAMAYAGGALTDAKVSYRVVRNARFPFYRWSRHERITPSREMEITSGVIQTGDDGTFSIRFTAIPDLNVAESYDPVFTYTLYADVTDISGETRSGQTSVSAGYKAMEISTDLEEYMNGSDSLKIRITTANLAGQPEQASGTVQIFKVNTPGQVLFTRKWARPDKHTLSPGEFRKHFPGEVYDNEDDITTWQKGATIFTGDFKTPDERGMLIQANPQPGMYMAEIRSADRFGSEVVHTQYFNVYKPVSGKTEMTGPLTVQLTKNKAEPGETVSVVVASPLRKATVRFEAESFGGKLFQRTLLLDREQMNLEIPVFEEHRGNISFNFTMVYRNRVVRQSRTIVVPFTNKELDITVGSFRSALEPGAEEEWQVTVKDKKGDRVAAELLAGMYDASLDAFVGHAWPFSIYENFRGANSWNSDLSFNTSGGMINWYPRDFGQVISKEYESLAGWDRYGYREVLFMAQSDAGSGIRIRGTNTVSMVAAAKSEAAEEDAVFFMADEEAQVYSQQESSAPRPPAPGSEMVPAKPRTDFSETAFFFPQLATNENGETVLKFKMPESLTRWRMMGLAHAKDLKTGYLEKSLVTRKELMVFPNVPRFLREGDRMEFSARIANLSDQALNGQAEIRFFDAITMQPADDRMKVGNAYRAFSIKQNGNALVTWEIMVPEGIQAVVYRITASAGSFSDGEEAALPVLTNRMLVTESLPLPVRGNSSKTYTFDKLLNSGKAGSTLKHYRLTLEYTSNPAWYAVQALPYLMEYPHECAEQVFSRFYANTLASHIANSDPKIRRVFDAWKMISPDALKSNLEKNEELKSLLIQETPWVREAKDETERKQRLGLLFDLNRMSQEQSGAYRKLSELQMANGGWPWFSGMPESEYITRHILTGFGRLKQSGAITASRFPDLETVTERAIRFLDQQMLKSFQKLKKDDPEYRKNNHLGNGVIHYLYARSYFYTELPEDSLLKEMIRFYKEQSVQYWPRDNNYLKGMAALYLNRYGERKTALLIMKSLSETALHSEEMGMYWRNQRRGWFWYEAPVETHALLIAAFDEVAGDEKAVEALKVWLLKQKQTQDWGTTKATAEAVHALLMRGESLLASDEPVQIRVGNQPVDASSGEGAAGEPGTGYFKTAWTAPEISPAMGRVEVKNPNHGPAWGALYWQYFEQLDKITSAGSPLSLKKELFREANSPLGPVLEAITPEKPLQVGDKVVVRVILTSDRDMEYVHLKDMRAAAFEPVNVLSGYRWQAGLGYYESTRDAATNFFIGYLPKGTWVFEYRLHATQKGEFSNGITTVQCMYAPEFGAHSEGIRVKVE